MRNSQALTSYLIAAVKRAGVTNVEPPDMGALLDPEATCLEAWQAVAKAYSITLDDLALCVAEHFRTECGSVTDVPPHVLKLVPDNIARQYGTIPIREEDRRLFVATSDPTDFDAEQALGFASGRGVDCRRQRLYPRIPTPIRGERVPVSRRFGCLPDPCRACS